MGFFMKRLARCAAALLALLLLSSCAGGGKKEITILYIGNSFVYTGNVPKQVRVLAKLYGVDSSYKSVSKGGGSLSDTMDAAMRAMDKKQYTYVVIQDYDTRPGSGEFFADVKALCDKAHATGATPVLYSPAWVNIDAVPDRERQREYTDAYLEAAARNGALLANAGDAWVYAYDAIKGLDLYQPNDYHANDAGAYLTACVFVSTLFDLRVQDVTKKNRYCGELAIPLGQAAWEFVKERR
jgi:hypothetical protein